MSRSRSLVVALVTASCLGIAGCQRPEAVRTGAQVASARLSVMTAQASRQQQIMNTQLDFLANAVAESSLRAGVFRTRSADIQMIWRVRQSSSDKENLRFITELQSQDETLLANPYALVMRPPTPSYAAASSDVSGLATAIGAMSRLSGDNSLSPDAAGAFLLDVLGKIELPKQNEPADGT